MWKWNDRRELPRQLPARLNNVWGLGMFHARFFAICAVLFCGTVVSADSPADGFWTTPAISGYGRMHPLPRSAYRPDPHGTYRIVFDLTKAAQKATDVNPSLDRVARTVNLYVASGVPVGHLHFVVAVHGAATPLVLNNAQYQAANGVDNPNLPLIALLRHAGIDVAVCGQAVAELGLQYDWIDPSVTLSLSALTTISTLQARGYQLLPL